MRINEFVVDTNYLSLEEILSWEDLPKKLSISSEVEQKISDCHKYLQTKISNSEEVYYGINTGFGALCDQKIAESDLEQLQKKLILSHCCGVGEPVDVVIVKWMLLLKIISLSKGHSGVKLDTVNLLLAFYNLEIIPEVFEKGSLGASGDLAPLAHMSLPLLGLGHVYFKGQRRSCKEVLNELNLEPIKLSAKEGLALLNGTQFMLAHAVYAARSVNRILNWAVVTSAMSIDAYSAKIEPLHPLIHKVRHQRGQILIAKALKKLLDGSAISEMDKPQVQDPYSFRCIPQVLGAASDGIRYFNETVDRELNAVTDNPIIFPEEDVILSGGNFHGEPLAMVLDHLAIVLSEIGSISERRIYRMLSGQRGLPKFLVNESGLNSGFMIPQYTAAALVNQNKQLSSPNVVDSIESSNGQEDHVSMGANAALKVVQIIKNVENIIGIELLCATQALDFRNDITTSPSLKAIYKVVREVSAFNTEDRYLKDDIDAALSLIQNRCIYSLEELSE
ncbi:MAG: histidine ammonia-lyase [Flavobacteriales bacterium]|nr:histidine ammonia-lyase [Flavobacteriales bacterium]